MAGQHQDFRSILSSTCAVKNSLCKFHLYTHYASLLYLFNTMCSLPLAGYNTYLGYEISIYVFIFTKTLEEIVNISIHYHNPMSSSLRAGDIVLPLIIFSQLYYTQEVSGVAGCHRRPRRFWDNSLSTALDAEEPNILKHTRSFKTQYNSFLVSCRSGPQRCLYSGWSP